MRAPALKLPRKLQGDLHLRSLSGPRFDPVGAADLREPQRQILQSVTLPRIFNLEPSAVIHDGDFKFVVREGHSELDLGRLRMPDYVVQCLLDREE